MDFEFRKLEKDAGKDASSALLQIMELKMSDFKSYIDQRFEQVDQRFEQADKHFTTIQWMIGLSVTFLAILMTIFNFLKLGA